MDFARATPADFDGIQALLGQVGLPHADLQAEQLDDFFVARGTAGVVRASVGLQRFGQAGLLRSLAVAPALRGHGAGRAAVDVIELHARQQGVAHLYLLTTTAAAFFAARAYAPCDRAAVPSGIGGTAEFASLCPASAVCLAKNLDRA